jgi:hypothetical protein
MSNKIHSNQLLYPLSGSFSGSFNGIITNALTASYVNPLHQDVIITGSIIFNSGSQITSTYYGNTYPGYIDIVAGAPDGFVELLSYNQSSSVNVDDYSVYITTQSGSLFNLWEFKNSGRLVAPRGIEAPSFTGSLYGTSSWAISASWAPPSSVSAGGTNKSIQFNDNGPLSGSNNFTFDKATSQISLTGSLVVTQNISASSFTGSLFGTATTASYVLQAVSSSFASTASYVQTAQTASYVLQAVSASFASTASLAPNYVLTSVTSSMLAPYVLTSVTSSMLQPYVLTSITSSMLAPYVLTSQTSSMSVLSASFASTVPSTGIVGDIIRIATGSVTASVTPTGFTVVSGSMTEFSVTGTGVTIGSAITDTHQVTGSLRVTGSAVITGSFTTNGNTTLTSTQNTTSTPILTLTGAVSASASSSRALNITSTLIASSSNDSLIALDIQPTFTIGSFTRYKNLGLRIGTSYSEYNTYANALNLVAEINGNAGVSGNLNVGGDSSFINLWGSGAVANGMRIGANYTNPTGRHLYLADGGTGNKQFVLVGGTGNVIIQNGGTFTDAGFKLDVQGTTRINGATTITDNTFLSTNTGARVMIGSGSVDTINVTGFEIKSAVSSSGNGAGTTRGVYIQPSLYSYGSTGTAIGFDVQPAHTVSASNSINTLTGHRLGLATSFTNISNTPLTVIGLDLPLNMTYNVGSTQGTFRIINCTPTYTYNQVNAFSGNPGTPTGSTNIGINFNPTYTTPTTNDLLVPGWGLAIRPLFSNAFRRIGESIASSYTSVFVGPQFNHVSASGLPVYSRGIYYSGSATLATFDYHSAFENVNGNNFFNTAAGNTGIGYAASTTSPPAKLAVNGTFLVTGSATITGSLLMPSGSNTRVGTAILVAGNTLVSNTAVTANSLIYLTTQTVGGIPGALYIGAKSAGTSFAVSSSNVADTSTFAYFIIN